MIYRTWILAALLAASLGSVAQAADDLKSAFKDLKSSCKDDIGKFCNDIQPGSGQLSACLNSNSQQLSGSCNDARAKVSGLISQAHMDFQKSCGTDVQKYCSDVSSGKGQVHDCLNQHLDSLSNSCKSLQAKINQRMDKGMG